MFINFKKFFEFIFKSFDVSSDTKLIKTLEEDGTRFLIIIKRHWFYAFINFRRLLVVFILILTNIYLLIYKSNSIEYISIIISVFLFLNLIYWFYIIRVYIKNFIKVYGKSPYIEDVHSAKRKSDESDKIFTNFFNQSVFVLIIFFCIITYIIYSIVSNYLNGDKDFLYGLINIGLLIFQFSQTYAFFIVMINLEMDFKVVAPGKIIFYDQHGLFGDTKIMKSDKIKTLSTVSSSLVESIFNFGKILILSEGDQNNNGKMYMYFIGNPVKTVTEIEKVISNNIQKIEDEVNVLLKKFENEIGISDISSPGNKEKLKNFIKNNEDKIKEIYNNGDEETKREVKQLYVLIED